MRRFRYVVIVLVLGAAAACTSEAKPGPTDPPSTPPSTSATRSATPPIVRSPSPTVATTGPNVRPGETVPVLPALAKTNSRPGAAAFAYHYFRALDWGYATTDSTLARTLFLPACSACAEFMKNFDETKVAGQHFKGGRMLLRSRQLVSDDKRHPSATVVDVTFDIGSLQVLSASGQVVSKSPAQRDLRYRVWLQWAVDRWSALDYSRVEVR